jgi:hypothetical protein
MFVIELDRLLGEVEARKAQLGLCDKPETLEALRNKGERRSPAKCEMLRRGTAWARSGQGPDPSAFLGLARSRLVRRHDPGSAHHAPAA